MRTKLSLAGLIIVFSGCTIEDAADHGPALQRDVIRPAADFDLTPGILVPPAVEAIYEVDEKGKPTAFAEVVTPIPLPEAGYGPSDFKGLVTLNSIDGNCQEGDAPGIKLGSTSGSDGPVHLQISLPWAELKENTDYIVRIASKNVGPAHKTDFPGTEICTPAEATEAEEEDVLAIRFRTGDFRHHEFSPVISGPWQGTYNLAMAAGLTPSTEDVINGYELTLDLSGAPAALFEGEDRAEELLGALNSRVRVQRATIQRDGVRNSSVPARVLAVDGETTVFRIMIPTEAFADLNSRFSITLSKGVIFNLFEVPDQITHTLTYEHFTVEEESAE